METSKIVDYIMDVAGKESQDNTVRVVMNLGDGVRRCYENGKEIPFPTEEEVRRYERATLDIDSGGNHEQTD